MLLAIACLFATAAAGPVLYDQRQEGEFNAQVDISNLLFVFAVPKKIPTSLFDIFSKSHKPDRDHDIQERADLRVMEAFVEPNTPYRVEIGSNERSEGDGRAVEVVIAGRRHMGSDVAAESQEQDELKLLGATENCGPDRVRDSVTLMCKDIQPVEVAAEPAESAEPTKSAEPAESVKPAESAEPAKPEPSEPEAQTSQKEIKVEPEPTPEVVPS